MTDKLTDELGISILNDGGVGEGEATELIVPYVRTVGI